MGLCPEERGIPAPHEVSNPNPQILLKRDEPPKTWLGKPIGNTARKTTKLQGLENPPSKGPGAGSLNLKTRTKVPD